MSWLGAGIGAGLGMAFGGPIGAAIGGCIGASLSGNANQVKASRKMHAQQLFFVSVFSMFGKMAKADGVVSKEEITVVEEIIRKMRIDAEDRKVAIRIFNNAKSDPYSIFDYASQYRKLSSGAEMNIMVYRFLFTVAMADNVLHPEEKKLLQQIPPYLGLDKSIYATLVKEASGEQADLEECYKVLGCSPESSDGEIKQAYRKMSSEYHPDKISSKGLPDGFNRFAEDQMKKINQSYDLIRESRK